MELNQKRIDSIFKKTLGNLPTIDMDDADLIFPLEVKTGFVNATEEGFVFDADPTDFGRFERIFSGYEAISAIWEQSSFLVQNDAKDKLTKTYQPGRHFLMKPDSDTDSMNITSMLENEDFLKESIVTSISYYTTEVVNEKDIFNLFIIPKKYNKIYFYITSVEKFYEPGTNEYKYSRVEFSSLNDKLAQTGVAIDQYVQRSAPGEGYAWPQLLDSITEFDRRNFQDRTYEDVNHIPSGDLVVGADFLIKEYDRNGECMLRWDGGTFQILKNDKGYILDGDALMNTPIKSMQIELYTPGVLSSLYAFGRPVGKGTSQNESMEAPRALIPLEAQTPSVSQRSVTRPYSANNEYTWLSMSHLEIESFYKDWKTKVSGDWNPDVLKKWLGYLSINTNDPSEALRTNGFGRIIADVFSLGLSEFAWNAKDDMIVDNQGVFEVKGPQTIPKMLATGYFKNRAVSRLPLDFKESIPWSLKDIPLVGGFLTKATMGLPIGWKDQNEIGGKLFNISGLTSNGFYSFYKNTWMGEKKVSGNEKYTGIPLDALSDKAQPSAISPSEFSTILNFTLTDQFRENGTISEDPTKPVVEGGALMNTQYLGYTDENGSKNAKWSGKAIPVANATEDGYAIDGFGFHFLGQGDYRVLFFGEDNNTPLFTGTYRTLSKITNSIRDWSNFIKTSHWKADVVVDSRKSLPTPDITIPLSPDDYSNGREHGLLVPQLLLDVSGVPQRDAFGNLIYQTDADGNITYKLVPQKFSNYNKPNAQLTERVEPLNIKLTMDEQWTSEDSRGTEFVMAKHFDWLSIAPKMFDIQKDAIKKNTTGYDIVTISGTVSTKVNGKQEADKPLTLQLAPIQGVSGGLNFVISTGGKGNLGNLKSIFYPIQFPGGLSSSKSLDYALYIANRHNNDIYWKSLDFDAAKWLQDPDSNVDNTIMFELLLQNLLSEMTINEVKSSEVVVNLKEMKFGFF